MRTLYIALMTLLLLGAANCQYDDEMGEGMGGMGGMDEGGEGMGGMGGEEPPPPQAAEVEELTSVEAFEAFIDNADASVVAAFTAKEVIDPSAAKPDGWDDDEDGEWEAPMVENPAMVSFNSISSSVYGYRYAYTTAPEVLEKLKSKKGGLYLYRSPKFLSTEHGDRPRERFPSDKLTETSVSSWLAAKAQPLVGQYSSATKDRYSSAVLVIFMNLDFEKNVKGINYVLKRARKAAVGFKGKMSIAVASSTEMSYEMGDFGLTSTKPTSEILMGISAGGKFYSSSATSFSANALSAFAESYLAGELSPYVKPEEPADVQSTDGDEDSEEEGEDDTADKEEV